MQKFVISHRTLKVFKNSHPTVFLVSISIYQAFRLFFLRLENKHPAISPLDRALPDNRFNIAKKPELTPYLLKNYPGNRTRRDGTSARVTYGSSRGNKFWSTPFSIFEKTRMTSRETALAFDDKPFIMKIKNISSERIVRNQVCSYLLLQLCFRILCMDK